MKRSASPVVRLLAALGCLALLWPRATIYGQSPPLHERIDALIDAAAVGPIAGQSSDADFVRRIYLDLTGVIPTPDETRAFLADQAPDKRPLLIQKLIDSPAFERHMTIVLDVALMERRPDAKIKQAEWQGYLFRSLADKKPLDQLYRELLASDGADAALRPAARFVLDRDAEPNLLTRDIGRLALGMDLQCAQCHDHPLIDDYYQADYYGLFAFVQRTSLFNDAKAKQFLLAENADTQASFQSVFTKTGSDRAMPQLPKGAVLYVEPSFLKGEEYVSVPDKEVRGLPKFSRRAALAAMLADSREFRRNAANRLWALLFGRGIVHPVDFHHAGNPPAHPVVLTLLADELKASGFDLRLTLRELALTRAYQRSCDVPPPASVNLAEIADKLVQLEAAKAERAAALEPLVAAATKTRTDKQAVLDQSAALIKQLVPLEAAVVAAKTTMDKTAADRKAAEDDLAKKRDQAQAVADASTKAAEAVAKLPEDKVLAEAAAKIAERSKELVAFVEGAAKLAAERATQQEAAAAQLASTQDTLTKTAAARPAAEAFVPLEQAHLSAVQQAQEAQFAVAALHRQIAIAKAILEHAELAKTDAARAEAAWGAIVEQWTIGGQVALLRPLTPEQFAYSGIQAAGLLTPRVSGIEAAIDAKPPEPLAAAADADKPKVRTQLVQTQLLDQLRGPVNEFVTHYGGQPGQDFQATVNQSLYFGNGGTVDSWLKPGGENLAARLLKLEDPAALSEELYLSILSRPATDAEKLEVAEFLKDRATDKPVAVGELIWALLSSNEFRFNH